MQTCNTDMQYRQDIKTCNTDIAQVCIKTFNTSHPIHQDIQYRHVANARCKKHLYPPPILRQQRGPCPELLSGHLVSSVEPYFWKEPSFCADRNHFHARGSFSRTLSVSLLGSHLARLLRKSLFSDFFLVPWGETQSQPEA